MYVLNLHFEIEPVKAYYMDGAFWPLESDLRFPLNVTHYRKAENTDFDNFASSPRKMKRPEIQIEVECDGRTEK